MRGETVDNRPLEVQRYRRVDEIKTCHILFISRSEAARLEQILVGPQGPQHPHRGRRRRLRPARRHDSTRHRTEQDPADHQRRTPPRRRVSRSARSSFDRPKSSTAAKQIAMAFKDRTDQAEADGAVPADQRRGGAADVRRIPRLRVPDVPADDSRTTLDARRSRRRQQHRRRGVRQRAGRRRNPRRAQGGATHRRGRRSTTATASSFRDIRPTCPPTPSRPRRSPTATVSSAHTSPAFSRSRRAAGGWARSTSSPIWERCTSGSGSMSASWPASLAASLLVAFIVSTVLQRQISGADPGAGLHRPRHRRPARLFGACDARAPTTSSAC